MYFGFSNTIPPSHTTCNTLKMGIFNYKPVYQVIDKEENKWGKKPSF